MNSTLEKLIDQLFDSEITRDIWLLATAEELKQIILKQAKTGKGKDNLTESDRELINEYLNSLIVKGKVNTKELDPETNQVITGTHTFSLTDLLSENISREEFKNRIRLYEENTRIIQETLNKEKKKELGFTEVLNILGSTKTKKGINHAPICIHASAQGWMNIDEFEKTLGLPPRHPNCVCSVVYR